MMTTWDDPSTRRKVEHLPLPGARATGEFLAESAARIGGAPAIVSLLNEYQRITPGMVRAAGGDRFPPRVLHVVPREVRP